MQYMLMFRETTESFATRQDQKAAPEYWGAWMAYIGALHASGKVVNGDGLEPPQTATIVRIRDGKRQVQDGPFPDTREHLGGYFVLEVASLEEALECLKKDHAFLTKGGVFDEDILSAYIALKEDELTRFRMTTHPVEFDMYYSS